MNAEFTLRVEVKQWKNPERVNDTSPAAFLFFIMCSKKSGTLAIASRAAVITVSALGAEL